MLLLITEWLQSHVHGGFGVFEFITFRAIVSTLTALGMALLAGPWLIRRLADAQIGQQVRDDGPQSHLSKSGTPTMGGGLTLLSVTVATLLWGDLGNRFLWIVLLVTLAFGVIGGADDYCKLMRGSSHGLSAGQKYLAQSVVGLVAALALYLGAQDPAETALLVPYAKDWLIPLGWLFVPLTYCVIVGSSNAVNLTDGLDGLAILPAVLVAGALGVFAYATSRVDFADYLGIPYVQGADEMVVFCGALVGAGLGFLWFNTYPAQVFMGDIGSLALGAALGTIAVVVRQELVLFIMAGVFVAETLSVMLQVGVFKRTGRRVFRMAPLHHHFELKGWPEPRVIVRLWIITVVLVLIGLASLKLR